MIENSVISLDVLLPIQRWSRLQTAGRQQSNKMLGKLRQHRVFPIKYLNLFVNLLVVRIASKKQLAVQKYQCMW